VSWLQRSVSPILLENTTFLSHLWSLFRQKPTYLFVLGAGRGETYIDHHKQKQYSKLFCTTLGGACFESDLCENG
jgi:hypothetical protein